VSASGRQASVLYVSYDGALEPLGESQIVSYVERLGHRFPLTLLTFEKPADLADRARVSQMETRLDAAGVRWVPLRYHKRPSLVSTIYDLARGTLVAARVARRAGVGVVHARGYAPSVVAAILQRRLGTRFLFDMRGFWPDEKVDAGHWRPGSGPFRLAKRWERRFFESADGIVSLTVAGVAAARGLGYAVPASTPFEVIPTCTDLARFAPGPPDPTLAHRLGVAGSPVIGCIGTISNWYLRQPMLDYLAYLIGRVDKLAALVVTQEDHEALYREAIAAGVPAHRLRLTRARFADMPAHLRLMDVGLFFIKPVFSKRGSAATKLGEFLATGVPVVINDGVGDSGLIVREGDAGAVLADVGRASFTASLPDVRALLEDPEVARRCRATAERWFDLRVAVDRYAALYERLGAAPIGRDAA
jgi:glycosyltransferase involved in cell wall biosynthesis